jgi:hypothetical protein
MAQDKYYKRAFLDDDKTLRYGGPVQKGVRNIADPYTLAFVVNKTHGNVVNSLFEQDLVDYADNGALIIKKENIKSNAAAKVKQTQAAAERPRSYWINDIRQEAAASGRLISYKAAENRVNRAEAVEATAILVAARSSDTKLTPVQYERLEKIADGGYLDLVYGQYKSGDRGTFAGTKVKERRASNEATPAAREDRKRDFYQNVMQRRSA